MPLYPSSRYIVSGSAATPGLAFAGDEDTGFFSPGAGVVSVACDGVERQRFGATAVIVGILYGRGGASSNNTQLRFSGQKDGATFAVGTDINAGDGAKEFEVFDLTASASRLLIDANGNVLIGEVTGPTTGTKALVFGDGTAPSGMATNTCALFGDDVAGTLEAKVIDEAANVTQLSMHAANSPLQGVDDDNPVVPVVLYHANHYLGTEEWLHLSALVKAVEKLTGKQFSARRALPQKADWDAHQKELVARREREILEQRQRRSLYDAALAAWQRGELGGDEPEWYERELKPLTPKPMPAWMRARINPRP